MPPMCSVMMKRLAALLNSERPLKIIRNSIPPKTANNKQYRHIKLFARVNSRELMGVFGASD